jgi:hypothetical protein
VNDNLIDLTLANEHQQPLQGWAIQRRARLPLVIEPLINNGPSQEALRLDVGSAEIVLDLAGPSSELTDWRV